MSAKQGQPAELETIMVREPAADGRWRPVLGREIAALLRRKDLPDIDARRVETETCRILSKCVGPQETAVQRTGLVVGYVQSGKTLSFTALAALARDNKYRLVIVLGGTTTNLVEQTYKRLADDLDVDGDGQRLWSMFENPTARPDTTEEIGHALRSWTAYPDRPERCPTVLIVVMKNHMHLNKLGTLLKALDLNGVNALVIDDEGDQAGLNNKVRQREESTTYTCIGLLRRVLPTHTYLMYTATPQAPLLISRIDMLSPEFADPLEPGEGYVGGRELFREGSPYIETIPASELPDDDAADGPPGSLEKALRLFFVGVAAGCVGDTTGKNRSMMIHPSQRREWHRRFVAWSRSARTSWLTLLRDPQNSPDRRALIDEFRSAYDDLKVTELKLPDFGQIEQNLEFAVDQTQIKEVNARQGRIPTVKWKQNYSFVLVGGAGLDRGFTVEGITVTYMPRGAGIGNADTVQQRGRFFGYKRDYLGFVRIFLEQGVETAFRSYVEHEKSIRDSLKALRDSGKPLSEWRRAFFLDRSMSPTRRSVLSLDYMRGRWREWTYARQPHLSEVLTANKSGVAQFVRAHADMLVESSGDSRRTADQKHLMATGVPLAVAYKELLVPFRTAGDDLLDHVHVLLQIERELDQNPRATCDLYLMSKGARRERGIDSTKSIKNLMQGANPRTGYPGDRELKSPDHVAIQIHVLDLRAEKPSGGASRGKVVAEAVPVIAVAIPERMRGDVIFEPSDG